ncbi:MAG: NAD-dependent deacetylase, partial [Acidimicrobiales bacterium]|nr:NAD-dependent deacetylase [Acidimicrobiales bacterium]
GSILKTATVMFGEALDPDVLDAAILAAADCDVLLAVGTTLTVHPAAGLCDVAVRAGAELVVVNGGETAYDDLAQRVVRGSISDTLPTVIDELVPPS